MTVVAVIPARQWSVGTPGKNRRTFVDGAIAMGFKQVIVTTDDPVIQSLCSTRDVLLIKRPPELWDGPMEDTVAHAVEGVEADVVVILQPSSPSRNRSEYIEAALLVLQSNPDATSVVSVVPWVGEPPQKACYRDGEYLTVPAPMRRQDCAPAFRRDGTVYAVRMAYAKQGDLYGPRPVPLLVTPSDSVTID